MNEVIQIAGKGDAAAIASLVNKAYRPGPDTFGWTHESELVAGDRISAAQVEQLFRQDSLVLALKCDGELTACVHVERSGRDCWIGMLATDPARQASGMGKKMLAAAEGIAIENFSPRRFMMSVLNSRPELLSFYQRRGYALTGKINEYPRDAGVGIPLSDALKVLEMQKMVV